MAEKLKIGRRNPKVQNHWEDLDLHTYVVDKPIILVLGGNATTDTKSCNGYCKIVENLIGMELKSGDSDNIYEYADIVGVIYPDKEKTKQGDMIGDLGSLDAEMLVDNILAPLVLDQDQHLLSIDECKKNLSQVTFFSHCQGALETYKILSALTKVINKADPSVNSATIVDIMSVMTNVSYAPVTTATLCPAVRCYSIADSNEQVMWPEKVVEFNRNTEDNYEPLKVARSYPGENIKQIAETIDIMTVKMEHEVSFIERNNLWQLVNGEYNEDCVSQMMAYSLARSVANSITNAESDSYIPKISFDQLYEELESIQSGFAENIAKDKEDMAVVRERLKKAREKENFELQKMLEENAAYQKEMSLVTNQSEALAVCKKWYDKIGDRAINAFLDVMMSAPHLSKEDKSELKEMMPAIRIVFQQQEQVK